MSEENTRPDEALKSIVTSGEEVKPGAVLPSIARVSVISGSGEVSWIVPATSKAMASAPGAALASSIAVRSEPAPASKRLVTV